MSKFNHFINALYKCYILVGASQVALVVKNPPADAGDLRHEFNPWARRSPGGGHGNPLQYFCLENSMDRGAWWATVHKATHNRTWAKPLGTHICGLQRHGSPFITDDCASIKCVCLVTALCQLFVNPRIGARQAPLSIRTL